jgi:hypothetical protein
MPLLPDMVGRLSSRRAPGLPVPRFVTHSPTLPEQLDALQGHAEAEPTDPATMVGDHAPLAMRRAGLLCVRSARW